MPEPGRTPRRKQGAGKVAVPAARPPPQEPVWLVRAALVLVLVGFAAFLAREVQGFLASLP